MKIEMDKPTSLAPIPHFNWYSLVSNEDVLEQGDLLDNFPIIVPPPKAESELADGEELELPLQDAKVIVMSQSCDLADFTDDDYIIVCPRYLLRDSKTITGQNLDSSDGWGKLRRGNYVHFHLLNKCEIDGNEIDYQIVDLRRVYSAPLGVVKAVAQAQNVRIRLLPPYREHLSQAFARQFMRIGLPIDLPSKYPASEK